jgi:hypothetical protein
VRLATPTRGILGRLFPPDLAKLGKVPEGTFLLHLLDVGEVKSYVHPKYEQDWATNAKQWDGNKWVPLIEIQENTKIGMADMENEILTYGNL